MRRYRIKALAEDEGEINLTPMIDIVFIMLIFFIVTVSFVKESGVPVDRPVAEAVVVHENATIAVTIDAGDAVWINGRRIDIRAVRANVERLRRESPHSTVVIHADAQSNNGVFVTVLDQVHLAGVKDVAIAADTEP